MRKKDKLIDLLYSGQADNAQLALELADSQNIDLSVALDVLRYFYTNGSLGIIKRGKQFEDKDLSEVIGEIQRYRYMSFGQDFLPKHHRALPLLKGVQEVYFYHPKFKEFPKELFDLQGIWRLVAADGDLEVITERISRLHKLRILRLSSNFIQKTPTSVGDMLNLKELHLNGNQLRTIPESLGNLANLKSLYLANNRLETLPASLSNLKNLQQFSVHGNPLDPKRIPKTLWDGNSIIGRTLQQLFV